ncbi:glycosyltransferase [Alkalihalophilus marmarensis]|uniref:glycosyltransferase n=1 Tax=Alkalihalophilus marmarensis TaxID=521377 RepID=UPI002DB9818A|nr:glycosyltransferase [Alkalihalophilus marmarensis]MEC2073716.1 glycosyltransferase [Alkalihalophilus marmarensis]
MRVLFFTPYFKQNRGNATTAKRIVHGLRLMDIEVVVFAYEEMTWNDRWQEIFDEVDLYHILHLRRFANWKNKHDVSLNKPYVLTSGGTDINEDLADPNALLLMGNVADDSCAVTVFTDDGKEKVAASYPDLSDRTHVIPQSIWLPTETDEFILLPKGNPVILLPAGLRKVKDIFYLWEAFTSLSERYPEMKVVFVGAALEHGLLKQVEMKEDEVEWFTYIGEVSLEAMAHIFKQADIVINTSISEGQPTALLEAMYSKRVVAARRNPGNCSVVIDGENGFTFDSPEHFIMKVESLINNPKQQQEIAEKAFQYVSHHHQFDAEIKAYVNVFNHCLSK